MKTFILSLALTAGLALAGCATPEARIRQNPAAFDRSTPAQQELIKKGKVEIGFDEAQVQLALGVPDRVSERTSADSKSVVWHYVDYEDYDGTVLYRGWYHRGFWAGGAFAFPYYADYPRRRDRDHFKVEFRDGKVVQIEEER